MFILQKHKLIYVYSSEASTNIYRFILQIMKKTIVQNCFKDESALFCSASLKMNGVDLARNWQRI